MTEIREIEGPGWMNTLSELLDRQRLASPTAGIFETADFHWWWRLPRQSDSMGQSFWFDADLAVACLLVTEWGGAWAAEIITMPDHTSLVPELWDHLQAVDREVAPTVLDVMIRDDDQRFRRLAGAAGWEPKDRSGVATWMNVEDLPAVRPLASGYRLTDRNVDGERPHHLVERNGPAVAERLGATDLYRPDLDLFVVARDDAVAAYGLFWFNPVTKVGLVEPMRTEDGHQGQGLAGHVLTAGLTRLAAAGATRMKVSYLTDNPVSERLYLGAGFVEGSRSRTYVAPRS